MPANRPLQRTGVSVACWLPLRPPLNGSIVIRTEGLVFEIRVSIDRFIDRDQPGWVECTLVDAAGVRHLFVEKVPIVTAENLWSDSVYPREGFIACTVVGVDRAADGREILIVETEQPDGVESTTGEVRFQVFPDQLVETNRSAG